MKTPVLIPGLFRTRLLANGKVGRERDHIPVIKLIDAGGPATWLLTEIRPDDPDLAYGLVHDPSVDRGPTLAYASLSALAQKRDSLGNPLAHEPDFQPKYPLSVYVVAARIVGAITDDPETLYLVAASFGIKPVASFPARSLISGRRDKNVPLRSKRGRRA